MRRVVLVVSVVLSLLAVDVAQAADAEVSSLTVQPAAVPSGQPAVATVTLSQAAPAGGQEVVLWWHGPSTGFPPRYTLVRVPEGQASATYEVLLPTSFARYEYNVQAYIRGRPGFANAKLETLPADPGEYRILSLVGPPAVLSGRAVEPVATINRPAPSGGLLLELHPVGASTPEIGGTRTLLIPAGSRRGTTISHAPNDTYIYQPRVSRLRYALSPPIARPPVSRVEWETVIVPWFFALAGKHVQPGTTVKVGVGIGEAPNPDGTTVSLSSDSPDVVVPETVHIPPGSPGAQFDMTVSATPSSPAARITARWNGKVTTGDVVIQGTNAPAPAPTPTPTPFPTRDTLAPRSTILSGPPKDTPVRGPVTFTFTANEEGSTFECLIVRGGGWELGEPEPCSSPKTYTTLEGGEPYYGLKVFARDPAGNRQITTRSYLFTLAEPSAPGPPPPAPVITEPADNTWLDTHSVTLRGTSEPGAAIEIVDAWSFGSLPARYWNVYASPSGEWSVRLTHLSEGIHYLTARAANRYGVSSASRTKVVMVDTQQPAMPAIVTPAAGSAVSGTFTLTGTAERGGLVEVYEDGVPQGTVVAPRGTWSLRLTGVSGGPHTYAVRGRDYAGNRTEMSPGQTLLVGT